MTQRKNWENSGCGEYWEKPPQDLSGSCKFSSLFSASIFGGEVQGNEFHQYCVIDKQIIDLNKKAKDVTSLDNPYFHDEDFFSSKDHIASMKFCKERVNYWLKEFAAYLNPKVISKPRF